MQELARGRKNAHQGRVGLTKALAVVANLQLCWTCIMTHTIDSQSQAQCVSAVPFSKVLATRIKPVIQAPEAKALGREAAFASDDKSRSRQA